MSGLVPQFALSMDLNPVAIYLASLAPNSRRTQKGSLQTISTIVSGGTVDCMNFEWHRLRYQHTQAIRSALMTRYAPKTANRHLGAMKRVMRECVRLELMDANDYAKATDWDAIKGSRLPPGRSLAIDEIRALLQACVDDKSAIGVRDACAIAILRLGLRRNEIVTLDKASLNLVSQSLIVRGKGNKDREVYFPDNTRIYIENWLKIRGSADGPLLLRIEKGNTISRKRLTAQAILYILEKRAKDAGLEHFSPHDFRRTCIGDLLDAGVDISTVASIVGHSKIDTTAKYDRRPDSRKKLAVEKLQW